MDQAVQMFKLLRPWQYTKNLFVFAAPFFGDALLDPLVLGLTLGAFGLFCAASSAVYVFNDYMDRERDRAHPIKKDRPLASGRVHPSAGLALAALLAALALGGGFYLSLNLGFVVLAYLVLNTAYSFGLKHIPLVDVLCITAGFLLRVLAGGLVTDVFMSDWLLISTLALALLLAFGKRRQELCQVGEDSEACRQALAGYNLAFLNQALTVTATATIMTYLLYLAEGKPPGIAPGRWPFLTSFFVVYGVFRYLALVHVHQAEEDPARLLLTDRPLQLTCLLWAGLWLGLIYFQ